MSYVFMVSVLREKAVEPIKLIDGAKRELRESISRAPVGAKNFFS